MIGYRKKSFARAHAMLGTLRNNNDDLDTLKSLQVLLIHEIFRTEQKIRQLKSEHKNIMQTGGARAAKRSSFLKNRIEGVRQCAYVWRCFGDAIAFTYMDKFALKQSFYNTENSNEKNRSGFISDKAGLLGEIALLTRVLEQEKIPALLVDLTNTIRYGDICLMHSSDPYLIEVKASKITDSRSRKQKRRLEKLQNFFETDQAAGLRGYPNVRRQETLPERNHIAELNACIFDARKNGWAVKSPEPGLSYLAVAHKALKRSDLDDAIRSIKDKQPWHYRL